MSAAAVSDLPLFTVRRVDPKPIRIPRTRAEQFADFHQRNGHVYQELVRLARDARARGANKLGMRMLWEVLRWNLSFQVGHQAEEFKLNNDFAPMFARLIMANEKDLADCFDVREREVGS